MEQLERIMNEVKKAVSGKDTVLLWILTALLAEGHVLLEDIPGVGKTTIALAFAKAMDLDYGRMQFTPDVLPSDVTGYSVYDKETGQMEYRSGAVLCNLFLADELNRATSRTQSALLEAMEEGQVTVDGVTYLMPRPFIVLATQNPLDFVGTYPLPEAQLDRFFMKIAIGYPTSEEESLILERFTSGARPMETVKPICTAQDIVAMQQLVSQVYSSKEVRAYISLIAQASRRHNALSLGVSTRAACRRKIARALLSGRDYVIPEDVQFMAAPVLAHRILLSPEARMRSMTAERVLSQVIGSVKVPVKLS